MKSYILPAIALCLLLHFLSSTVLWAQTPPKFRHLTTAEGLPSNKVYMVFEDKAGFLWIGTDAGLARYDGKNMQVFQHQSDNKNSIADNTIHKITQDGKGHIWVMTATQLHQYDPVLRQFKRYPRPDPHAMRELAILFADREGNIWWLKKNEGYKDGVFLIYQSYRVKTGEIKDYVCRFSLPKQDTTKVQSVYPNLLEYKGELYAAGGFMKYDKARDAFVQTYTGEVMPYGLRTHAMTHDEQGNIYYFGENRNEIVYKYNINNRKTELIINKTYKKHRVPFSNLHYMQTSATTFAALYDNFSQRIWLATFNGLVEIDLVKKQHFLYLPNRFDNFTLRNRVITCLFLDSKGNIWAGTENGLSYFPSRPQFFHEYPRAIDKKVSLSGSNVHAFAENEQKRIWVGTQNNISIWTKGTIDYDTLSLPNPQEPVYTGNSYGGRADIRTLISTGTSIYAGTWGAGIYKINPDNRKAEYLSPALLNEDKEDKLEIEKPLRQHPPFIRHVKADEEGNIWAIEYGIGLDLLRYNPRTQTFKRYPINKETSCFSNASDIAGGRLNSLAISPEKIYVASEVSGLYQFDRKNLCFDRHFSHDATNPKSLSGNKVITVFVSKAGEVWAGTENGLNRLKKDGTFERFQNFPNNYIAAIEEDDKGFLWIATQNGLCRFNPRDGKHIYYNQYNGLQSGGFNQNAIFKSSSGEIFVGGANGFNYFHPDSVITRQKQTAPHVVLTHLNVMNQGYVSQDSALEFRKAIALAHDENDLQFTFAALDLGTPDNNRYEYRLILKDDGFFNLSNTPDTAWVSMTNNNVLNLPRVSFGEYLLEVRASAAPDVWSSGEDVARLYLSISAPWYFTKTFVFMCFFMAILGIPFVVYYRAKDKEKREAAIARAKQQALEERNRILRAAVQQATAELQEKNQQLVQKNEEIGAQAEELKAQKEVIEAQREALQRDHEALAHTVTNEYSIFKRLIKEEKAYIGDAKAREIFDKMEINMAIRSRLMRSAYHKISAGELPATHQNAAAEYLTEVVGMLEQLAAQSNFEAVWHTRFENLQGISNSQMRYLERVLIELYHNAEKYLRGATGSSIPHISFTMNATEDGWHFSYCDTGKGYPEAILQQGASALKDLYRICMDLSSEPRIYNNHGAYFELHIVRRNQ